MDDGLSDLSQLVGWLGVAHDVLLQKMSVQRMRSILVSLSIIVTPAR
jgi:hypothetical protein